MCKVKVVLYLNTSNFKEVLIKTLRVKEMLAWFSIPPTGVTFLAGGWSSENDMLIYDTYPEYL